MITNFFLTLLQGLVSAISFVIPNVDFSGIVSQAGDVYGSALGWLAFLSPIVNVQVLFFVVQAGIDLLAAGLVFRFFNYVYNHIPFVGAFAS